MRLSLIYGIPQGLPKFVLHLFSSNILQLYIPLNFYQIHENFSFEVTLVLL